MATQTTKGTRVSRAPPFVVFVAAVATAVCDQVVPVQHVDDIDEVHQLDPVHQVDHKDELWGNPVASFCCFFFEGITCCALVGAILIVSSKSSIFGPLPSAWEGPPRPENLRYTIMEPYFDPYFSNNRQI